MEPIPTVDVVLQALNSLYKSADNDAKEKASRWLMEVQKSVGAWQIADHLLHLNRDEESSYFAAQTMRTKIQFSFYELPAENYEALCSSLMTHCKNITKDTKHTIVTQLSLALSDMALRIGTWKNAMAKLLQEFTPNEEHWDFLLEILLVYPEEINSCHLKLGENRRNEVYAELRETSNTFIAFLMKVVERRPNDVTSLSKVFKCLASWLNVYAIEESSLLSCNLMQLAFMAVSSSTCDITLHKDAADCISSALTSIEDLKENQQLAHVMIKEIEKLIDPYHLSVAMNRQEMSINFCLIFTEMSESLLKPMAQTPNQGFGSLKILDILLTCLGHHSYQVADVTFNFWNHLSDYLYEDRNKDTMNAFKPYICRLITSLCRLCKYDESVEGIREEEDDDFEEFRKSALNLVKDVQFIVGVDEILSQLNESLKQHTLDSNQSWNTYEAALFIMQAPAKKADEHDTKTTPSLIQFMTSYIVPSVPHEALHNTCLGLIGSFQRWFKFNPKYLEMVMPVIMHCFQSPKLAPSSALCLQKLCETCSADIIRSLPMLFNLLDAVESINLSQAGVIKLLEAVSSTLSCLPIDKVVEGLKHLCAPPLGKISKILENPITNVEQSVNDVCTSLDRLASILKCVQTTKQVPVDQKNPCFQVFVEMWPIYSNLMNRFKSEVKVIEHTCRCLRNAIRSFGRNDTSLILPIMSQMVEIYKEHPHSCCLYMGSIMVDSYASDPINTPLFLTLLDEFNRKTFMMIDQPDGMINYPDIVDDFFRLALRFTEQCPLAFLEFHGCHTIMISAIHSCCISHSDANATIVKFLLRIIELASSKDQSTELLKRQHYLVLALLNEHGKNIVKSVLDACLFKVPTRLISYLATINYQLLKIDREATISWLEESLDSLPSHSTTGCVAVTQEQKTKFLHSIITTDNEDEIGDLYEDFSLLFR